MDPLLTEFSRGFSTALAVRFSAVPCPECACHCAPVLSCAEGAVPRELGASRWPSLGACLALLGLDTALGAAAVLSVQRWLAPAPSASHVPSSPAPVLTDLSQEARAQRAELETAGLAEGGFIAVRYRVRGRRPWHRRLVTALVPGGVSVIGFLTPDYDEDLADIANIAEWTVLPRGTLGAPAVAMALHEVYVFQHLPLPAAVDAARAAAYARAGAMPVGPIVVDLAGRAGAGVPVGAAAAVAPARSCRLVAALPSEVFLAAPQRQRLCLRPWRLRPRPSPRVPALAFPRLRQAPRLLPWTLPRRALAAGPGMGSRGFGAAVGARGIRHMAWDSTWLSGEAALARLARAGTAHVALGRRANAQQSGTPTAHHQRWLAETGLDPSESGVEIHRTSRRILKTALTYDQVCATNLAHLLG
ncbi:unnamed protein product [Prorocentrum cordatum]|uniref:Uncharacterized protein n=1 Tax=Prorocentrum cordatum TaxID=2364126 RepID=A0ABN9S1F7_9DINO|nr:unnamed protein product [Polarella glacialis]